MSKIRKSAICLTIAISGGAISLYRVYLYKLGY